MSDEERNHTDAEAGEVPQNAREETEPNAERSRDQAEPSETGSGVEPLPSLDPDGPENEGSAHGEQFSPEGVDRALEIQSDAQSAEMPGGTIPAREFPVENLIQVGIVQEIYNEKRPFLVPISPAEIQRIQEIFVEPPGFQEWRRKRADRRRVYLVCGQEHAGKLTTAVNVALERTGGPEHLNFFKFRRPETSSPSLDTFLWSEEFIKCTREAKGETVYLAEDCFADRLVEPPVLVGSLEDLEDRLEAARAYLILSTEPIAGDLQSLQVEKISADDVDLKQVFERHLSRYQSGSEAVKVYPDVGEAAKSLWQEVQQKQPPLFRFPIQVRSFCHKLGELGYLASCEEIAQAANEAARIGRLRVRNWFQKLSPNQQLYALLVFLFQGLERQDLDLIYSAAIQNLQSSITELKDPRQEGYDDLLESIHARVEKTAIPQVRGPLSGPTQADEEQDEEDGSRDGVLEVEDGQDSRVGTGVYDLQQVVVFTDRAIEEEIRRQVRNHSAILWSLSPLLLQLAADRREADNWRFRKVLGIAIGQLGASNHREMLALLQKLASDHSAGVTAVAGAALGQSFASDPGFQVEGLQLLERWIKHPHPALTWAAGLAIWRAYYGLVETTTVKEFMPAREEIEKVLGRLLHLLEALVRSCEGWGRKTRRIALEETRQRARSRSHHSQLMQEWFEFWTGKNLGGAVYALRMIGRVRMDSAVDLIVRWLDERSKSHLPKVAAAAAIELFREVGEGKPTLTTIAQLQRLILPLLSFDALPFDHLGVIMEALRNWHRWQDIRDSSFADVLRIANRCRGRTAQLFSFAVVRFWLDAPGASAETRRYGQALLARIFAMDGSPVGVPGHERGLILLDTAGSAQAQGLVEAGRRLHWLLQSLVDTEIRLLGGTSVLVGSGETATYRGLLAAPRARLVVPTVEAISQLPAFVLVLSSGEILDLQDALEEAWANRLIVTIPAGTTKSAGENGRAGRATLITIDPQHPDATLQEVLIEVISHRFRALDYETLEDLGTWLQERLGLPVDDIEGIWLRLAEWTDELDASKPAGGDDPARRILCALRWWARADIEECVERLRAWREGPESELTGQVAGSAARMLFKMIGIGGWHPPVESHGRLFELADTLVEADEGWSGAEWVLLAAHNLVEDEDWRTFLFGLRGGLLLPWLRRLAPDYHEELERLARGWASSEDGKEEVPQAICTVAEEILLIARLGDGGALPTLTPGGSYRILVFDADDESPTQLRRAAQLAAEVFNKSRTGGVSGDHPWVIFRLGWKAPLREFTTKVTPNDLLSAGRRRPRLLHPLLDTLPLDAVDLVLVVSTGPLLDESDFAGSAWLSKIHCYVTDERWRKGGLLAQAPLISEAEGVSPILRYLADVSGARPGIEFPST